MLTNAWTTRHLPVFTHHIAGTATPISLRECCRRAAGRRHHSFGNSSTFIFHDHEFIWTKCFTTTYSCHGVLGGTITTRMFHEGMHALDTDRMNEYMTGILKNDSQHKAIPTHVRRETYLATEFLLLNGREH